MKIDKSKLNDHWSSIIPYDNLYYYFYEYAGKFNSFTEFWNNCEEPSLLTYWIGYDEEISHQQLVKTESDCVKLVLPLLPDNLGEKPDLINCVEITDKWINGEVELDIILNIFNRNVTRHVSFGQYTSIVEAVDSLISSILFRSSVSDTIDHIVDQFHNEYVIKEKFKKEMLNIIHSNIKEPTQLINEYNKLIKLKPFW